MVAVTKELFLKYESKIVLVFGFILVAVLSFEAGLIKGKGYQEKPIIIENSALNQSASQENNNNSIGAKNEPPEGQISAESLNMPSQNCAFVGSKNSNKYHLPTCRWAKQIKPENKVCFKDKNEAESKGYLPDKNCIK